MPASNSTMIHKLQAAINTKYHERILINRSQWYSENHDKPVTTYIVKKAVWDDDKKKTINIELFKSTSQLQIVLFLRDYWYELNGWEVPTDNEVWNAAKENYNKKKENGTIKNE